MENHATLESLEPDAFAAVCGHLRHREVAALAASCAALRHAVATNDRLWASLYQRQFPQPWARLTQRQASRLGQQQAGSSGVVPGAWRDTFLRTHDACYQVGRELRERDSCWWWGAGCCSTACRWTLLPGLNICWHCVLLGGGPAQPTVTLPPHLPLLLRRSSPRSWRAQTRSAESGRRMHPQCI